jgi:hypothetical protein
MRPKPLCSQTTAIRILGCSEARFRRDFMRRDYSSDPLVPGTQLERLEPFRFPPGLRGAPRGNIYVIEAVEALASALARMK